MAIVFQEAFQKVKEKKHLTLQIFATDIDSDAIEIARKGLVSTNSLAGVSQERISKFFIKDENGYRVNSSIREMVVFAPHNMIKDPPFTKIDLLFCRNVLIYMEPELQKQLMALFHYSLNPERIMLLGSAENENSQNNLFYPIDSTLKFYKRKATIEKTVLINFPSSFSHSMKQTTSEIKKVNYTDNIQVFADQILLQQYAPASVLINSEGDVLYISGKTGNYIEPAAGKANWNIYAMAREGFSIELPAAIRKAKLNYEAFKLSNIAIGSKERPVIVDITFQQIEKPDALKNAIMIVFYETKALPETLLKTSKKRGQKFSVREHELEIDLQHIREELQSTREEMQTTQEELKSANEEMQSTNEELQSTNEELTTSKEEMQSLNEELQTVNNELQRKIADYIVADNDMKNLLNSTDIATLFLDRELNIRRFTDQLTKLFKLRPTDIGRPFTDMVNDLIYPQMEDDAKAVLKTLIYKETEISTNSERWFTIRIMPYRTFDDHIDGLVMTFIDITKAKKLEEELTSTIAMLHEKKLKMP